MAETTHQGSLNQISKTMEKVYLVFHTDVWHTNASKELLCVCTSWDSVMININQWVAMDCGELSEEQADLLHRIGQTQGYDGTGEFIVQEMELDELF